MYESLDAERIRMHLSTVGLDLCRRIQVRERIDSTNASLIERLRTGQADGGDVCLAEAQSAGRGRRGRAWCSPANGNLYLSLAWPRSLSDLSDRSEPSGRARTDFPDLEAHSGDYATRNRGNRDRYPTGAVDQPQVRQALSLREECDAGAVTLAIGVAVREALGELTPARLGLKWPNDLYADSRKLGGILVERVMRADKVFWVIGIGINLFGDHLGYSTGVPPAGLVELWPEAPGHRNRLAGRIIDSVLQACLSFEREGFAVFQERWQACDVTRDRPVDVRWVEGRQIHGVGAGVDGRGRLRVVDSLREYWLDAGEVSLRFS